MDARTTKGKVPTGLVSNEACYSQAVLSAPTHGGRGKTASSHLFCKNSNLNHEDRALDIFNFQYCHTGYQLPTFEFGDILAFRI